MKNFDKVILWVLITATIVQVAATVWYFAPEAERVWRSIGKSAAWRGVNFSSSKDFADFMEFLSESIPPNGMVVLPPAGVGRRTLWHTPYMQFFLLPRQVVNCTGSDTNCPADLSRSGAYILVVGEDQFPGAGTITDPARLMMFNKNWGLYLPQNGGHFQGSAPFEFSSLAEIFTALLWSFLWIGLMTAAGTGIVTAMTPHLWLSTRLALGFGLAIGMFSLVMYLALWFGANLSPTLVVVLTAALVGAGLLAVLLKRKRERSLGGLRPILGYLAGLIGLTGFALILAVGEGYHASDEVVLWGIKGYGIASLGLSPGVSDLGTRTANYPLNIPLMIAAFRSLVGDNLPQSKMIFPLFYLSLVVIMLDFLRSRLPLHLAGWLTLAYASAPLVYYHATIAYANLPLSFYLAGGLILAIPVIDRQSTEHEQSLAARDLRILGLSSCFFALAAWTRPEGLVLAALAVALLAAIYAYRRSKLQPRRWHVWSLVTLALPLVIFAVLWLVSSPVVYQKAGWSQEAFRAGAAQILSGNPQLEQMAIVLRSFLAEFFDIRTWGIIGIGLFVMLIAPPLLHWFKKDSIWNPDWVMAAAAVMAIVTILGMYLLLVNDTTRDANWWVNTGLNRMLLPGITLLWLGLAGRLPEQTSPMQLETSS